MDDDGPGSGSSALRVAGCDGCSLTESNAIQLLCCKITHKLPSEVSPASDSGAANGGSSSCSSRSVLLSTLVQVSAQLMQSCVQNRPARLHPQRPPQSVRHLHDICCISLSGAGGFRVVSGIRPFLVDFQPHSFGSKLLPSHCCTCKYTRKLCW